MCIRDRRLESRPLNGKRWAVFGLLADKDLPGVVAPLLSLVAGWAVAPLDTPRSRSADDLAEHLRGQGMLVAQYPDVRAALDAQCEQAAEGDEILLFGSFFCVAEALDWLARPA